MRRTVPPGVVLREHEELLLPQAALDSDAAEAIRLRSDGRIDVQDPTRRNGSRWILRANGVVGALRLDEGRLLTILPKVPVANIFRMLEYAHGLNEIELPADLVEASTLPDLFERFAILLADRVLHRASRGFVRTYEDHADDLVALRGRIRFADRAHAPHAVALPCEYQEHTGDNEDNRILSWALHVVSRSPWCGERSRPRVRRALHAIGGIAPPVPIHADVCEGRVYHRLNDDYEPMHALARFFLRNCGPAHMQGPVASFPFLIRMDALFEKFVERWLGQHMPHDCLLQPQRQHWMSADGSVAFRMDLVVTDRVTGRVRCVLDSKYKLSSTPDSADVQQVIAYAEELGCKDALLVYPTSRIIPHDHAGRTIRVRSAPFDLSGELDAAGGILLAALLGSRPSD